MSAKAKSQIGDDGDYVVGGDIVGENLGLMGTALEALRKLRGKLATRPPRSPSVVDEIGTADGVPKIDHLSDEQVTQLAVFRDEWLAVGLSTAPADRARAEAGILKAYGASVFRDAWLSPPQIAWTSSPLKGVIAATIVDLATASGAVAPASAGDTADATASSAVPTSSFVTRAVWEEPMAKAKAILNAQVSPALVRMVQTEILYAIGDRMGAIVPIVGVDLSNRVGALKMEGAEKIVQDNITSACFGAHDAAWLGFYDYFRRVVGVQGLGCLDGLMEAARAGGWYWPCEGKVIASERPSKLLFDSAGRLHGADAAAIEYPDGYGVCAWHGVRVPSQAVLKPEGVAWDAVEKVADKDLREALAEIKALKWSGGEGSEEFEAALAAKRLGGVAAVRGITEG